MFIFVSELPAVIIVVITAARCEAPQMETMAFKLN